MTRTVLNWSELLDQYRGKSIEPQQKLKKWSEMGNPEVARGRYRTKPPVFIQSKHTEAKLGQPDPLSIQPAEIMDSDEKFGRIVESPDTDFKIIDRHDEPLRKLSQESIGQESKNTNDKKKLGPTIPELFYDTMMQDNETIPSMAANKKLELREKLSERDYLLIDLLDMNYRDRRLE